MAVAIMWFRRDLRVGDSPALAVAAAGGRGVVPLFVIDPRVLAAVGPNRRRFLAESLRELDIELDGQLVLRRGHPARVVPTLVAELGRPWSQQAPTSVLTGAGATGLSPTS